MLSTVYQLKRPRQFEVIFKNIELNQEQLLVRPTHLSICNADQRYYQGTRPAEILRRKLPMALIHEGIGSVVYDPTGSFQAGERVVMIPNLPVQADEFVAENYLRSSQFRASGVAAFTELVSVSYHALHRFFSVSHGRMDEAAVWGDGNLGYITALLLHYLRPQTKLYVVGVHEEKLSYFTFADETILTTQLEEDFAFDHALECVGGSAAGTAVGQIIDHIRPEGTIGLLGVSEELVPIETRMVLEKGLRIIGSSRSGRADFLGLMDLYRQYPEMAFYLENIVGEEFRVRDIKDIRNAFEADIHKLMGKTIMVWDE